MATESHAYKSNWSKLGNYELQKKVERKWESKYNKV